MRVEHCVKRNLPEPKVRARVIYCLDSLLSVDALPPPSTFQACRLRQPDSIKMTDMNVEDLISQLTLDEKVSLMRGTYTHRRPSASPSG